MRPRSRGFLASTDQLSVNEKGAGRRHGPKPTSGSFWTIDDETSPGINSNHQLSITQPRLTLGAVFGEFILF
jgi:hypothetical protein